MTDTEKADVVSRYKRGQSLVFISYATGHGRETVRAAVVEAGVEVKRGGMRPNRNWGARGGSIR